MSELPMTECEKNKKENSAFLINRYSYISCKLLILYNIKNDIRLLFDLVSKLSLREIIV